MCILVFSEADVKAASATEVGLYGFEVPSSGYIYEDYFGDPTILNVYTAGEVLIGTCVVDLVRARYRYTNSRSCYYDTLLIRAQMEPALTQYKKVYYHGISSKCEVAMTLNPNHSYVNIYPKATMPESSSTWDVSFSANGNSAKEFGFEIGTGYSSTIKDTCFDIQSNYSSKNKKDCVTYDYSVSDSLISTKAKRAINKWCTNTHQCFFAYTYTTPSNNFYQVTLDYDVRFRYTVQNSKKWDGSTLDIYTKEYKKQQGVTYAKFD